VKKWLRLIALLLLLPKFASAVVIHQVLYDPNIEGGGEAVELFNPESSALDISGWAIATETSSTDAIVPANTSITANGYFLIADKGWDESKNNSKWRSADYEETLTLTNTHAGIALVDSDGKTIDALGWGEKDKIDKGLFEGTPANHVKQGRVLLRTQDTDDNSKDFADSEPDFFGKNTIKVSVNVTQPEVSEIIEDDSPAPGVQLMPIAGETRHVKTTNSSFELPYNMAPGNYTIDGLSFEVLSLEAYDIIKEKITLTAIPGKKTVSDSKIIFKNLGNVDLDFGFEAEDLKKGEQTISIDYLSLVVDGAEQGLEDIKVKAGEETTVQFALFVPDNAEKGFYETMIYLII